MLLLHGDLGFHDCPGSPIVTGIPWILLAGAKGDSRFGKADDRRVPSPWALAELGDYPRV